MKTAFLVSLTLSALAPALAAPAAAAGPVDIETRQSSGVSPNLPTQVHVCANSNWGGPCKNVNAGFGECINWSDKFGSWGNAAFGPQQGGGCSWFSERDCKGTMSGYNTYPGYGTITGYWRTTTRSFMCFRQ